MSALVPLSQLIGINLRTFTKEEKKFLEAAIFIRVCEELKEHFRQEFRNYFYLTKYSLEKESIMLEENFICLLIKDILLTEEYSLPGIAYYTETPEEVIYEIVIGSNRRPSAIFLQKIIELHRTVRPDVYLSIMKKITMEYHAIT